MVDMYTSWKIWSPQSIIQHRSPSECPARLYKIFSLKMSTKNFHLCAESWDFVFDMMIGPPQYINFQFKYIQLRSGPRYVWTMYQHTNKKEYLLCYLQTFPFCCTPTRITIIIITASCQCGWCLSINHPDSNPGAHPPYIFLLSVPKLLLSPCVRHCRHGALLPGLYWCSPNTGCTIVQYSVVSV